MCKILCIYTQEGNGWVVKYLALSPKAEYPNCFLNISGSPLFCENEPPGPL